MNTPDVSARNWAVVLHLSQFAGYIIPFAGLLAPILIWQIKKNDVPGLDEHGKIIANWMISAFIYGVLCFFLTFILIGFLGFAALAVMAIVYPIIGAIKANDGVAWKYPLSIEFLKLDNYTGSENANFYAQ